MRREGSAEMCRFAPGRARTRRIRAEGRLLPLRRSADYSVHDLCIGIEWAKGCDGAGAISLVALSTVRDAGGASYGKHGLPRAFHGGPEAIMRAFLTERRFTAAHEVHDRYAIGPLSAWGNNRSAQSPCGYAP
jgi:hypothetical protein